MGISKKYQTPSERGSVIFVVMLLLVSSTLISIVALQLSASDTQVNRSQSHSLLSENIAKSGLTMVMYQFQRTDIDLLTLLVEKKAETTIVNDCDNAQTLCFSAGSFFPKLGSHALPHHAFRIDAFAPYHPDLNPGTSMPSIYGDYLAMVHSPTITATQIAPGYSTSLQMCTYQVTVTVTGSLINPHLATTASRYQFVEKSMQTQLLVTASNPSLCP